MNFIEKFFDWYPDHGDGSLEICCFVLVMTVVILWIVRQQKKRRDRVLAPSGRLTRYEKEIPQA